MSKDQLYWNYIANETENKQLSYTPIEKRLLRKIVVCWLDCKRKESKWKERVCNEKGIKEGGFK